MISCIEKVLKQYTYFYKMIQKISTYFVTILKSLFDIWHPSVTLSMQILSRNKRKLTRNTFILPLKALGRDFSSYIFKYFSSSCISLRSHASLHYISLKTKCKTFVFKAVKNFYCFSHVSEMIGIVCFPTNTRYPATALHKTRCSFRRSSPPSPYAASSPLFSREDRAERSESRTSLFLPTATFAPPPLSPERGGEPFFM